MRHPSCAVIAVLPLAAGCIVTNGTHGALQDPGHSSVISATRVDQASPPAQAASSSAVEISQTPSTSPGPVVPPERLPDFDPNLVRTLGPEGVRKLEVAASICPAAVVHDAGKLRVGCRACPPFDSSIGPDGQVAIDPTGDDGFYELENLIEGRFTEPGKTQVAAVFSGCEPHVANWGGTLLAERHGAVWVQMSYRSGFHPARCKTFPKIDAHDALVCLWETDHQSSVHWLLDTYDFKLGDDLHPESGWDNLLTLDDNSVSGCWNGKQPGSMITANQITDFVVQPATSSAPLKLVVSVQFSRGPATPAYLAKCAELQRDGEKKTKKPINPATAFKSVSRKLTLVWNGKSFTPDASSKLVMKQFGIEIEEPTPQASTCASRDVSENVIRDYCKNSMYKAIVLKNANGLIGGYVLQPSIMDLPIPYLDCNGNPLTSFHIFASDAEKSGSMKIIEPLRRAFPIEQPLKCGNGF